jgi:MoaA/NifB/PqqE/SkfB family radical SAM enzyme
MTSVLPHQAASAPGSHPELSLLWLELTGKCNLRCVHCYAESAPTGTHGTMTRADWEQIICQAKDLGVHKLQLIGGEPTIHPDFPHLVRYAAEVGLPVVEVFSNLIHVPQTMWQLFTDCQVTLATSFYSVHAEVHDQITKRPLSQRLTQRHIQEAVRRAIPLRVAIGVMRDDQDVPATEAMLRELGVTTRSVHGVQGVGRGAGLQPSVNEVDGLCGYCHEGKAMVAPDGSVYPCVFSRWLNVGNVHSADLEEIVEGEAMLNMRRTLAAAFAAREAREASAVPATSACHPSR